MSIGAGWEVIDIILDEEGEAGDEGQTVTGVGDQLGDTDGGTATNDTIDDLELDDFSSSSQFIEGDEANALWELRGLILLLTKPRTLLFRRTLQTHRDEGGQTTEKRRDSAEIIRFLLTQKSKVRVGIRRLPTQATPKPYVHWVWGQTRVAREAGEYYAVLTTDDVTSGIGVASDTQFQVIIESTPESDDASLDPAEFSLRHGHTAVYPAYYREEAESLPDGPELGSDGALRSGQGSASTVSGSSTSAGGMESDGSGTNTGSASLADGALRLARVDLSIPSVGPNLEVTRSYTNLANHASQSTLGIGWRHSFDQLASGIRMEKDGDGPLPEWVENLRNRVFSNGELGLLTADTFNEEQPQKWVEVLVRGVRFTRIDGQWYPQPGASGRLRDGVSSENPEIKTYIFTDRGGTEYEFERPRIPMPAAALDPRAGDAANSDPETGDTSNPDSESGGDATSGGDASSGGDAGEGSGDATGAGEDFPEVQPPTARILDSLIYRIQPSPYTLDDIATGDGTGTGSDSGGSQSDGEGEEIGPQDDPLPPPQEPRSSIGTPLGGRLLSMTAPNGQALNFQYDPEHHFELVEVRDDFSRALRYRYSACDVPGSCSSYSLAARRLRSVTLETPSMADRVVTYDYDGQGYLAAATYGPRVESYGYDPELPTDTSEAAVKNLTSTSIASPTGASATTRYTYFPVDTGGNGLPFQCRDDGSVGDFPLLVELDGVPLKRHEVVARTSHPMEGPNEDEYAQDGEPVSCFGYTKDPQSGLIERVVGDVRGNVTRYTLNRYGNVLRIQEPLGRTIEFGWNIDVPHEGAGRKANQMVSMLEDFDEAESPSLAVEHARSYEYSYDFDGFGFVTRKVTTGPTPDVSEEVEYDARFGLPTLHIDRDGIEQRWSYNTDGTLNEHTDGRGQVRRYTYYSNGLLRQVFVHGVLLETHTYDDFGYPASSTHHLSCRGGRDCSPRDEVTLFSHDEIGRLESVRSPAGHVKSFEYNYDRAIEAATWPALDSCPDGAPGEYSEYCKSEAPVVSRAQYDDHGRKLSETDLGGVTLSYTHTQRGRIASMTRSSDGARREFFYDNQGNLVRETDWRGAATTYVYDALNRRVESRGRHGLAMSMVYDLANNVRQSVDYDGVATS